MQSNPETFEHHRQLKKGTETRLGRAQDQFYLPLTCVFTENYSYTDNLPTILGTTVPTLTRVLTASVAFRFRFQQFVLSPLTWTSASTDRLRSRGNAPDTVETGRDD